MRAPTLASVAEVTGYHVSTVSRVLNGSTVAGVRAASPAAAERIREVARELGYRPNAAAIALRRRRTRLLGVVMARMADPVLATIYEGIEYAARQHGFHPMAANSWDDAATRGECIEALMAHGVDAVILGDSTVDGAGLDALVAGKVPFVLVNRPVVGYPSVTCDDRAGGRLAAEHLLDLGHRRVGVLAGLSHAGNAVGRTEGFLEVFRAAGCPVPAGRVVRSTFDIAGGRMGAERLLREDPAPTAIFAVSDSAALGVLGCLRDRGIVPGVGVSVVGFNDVPMAAELTIPLTSVRSPMRRMGEESVNQLLRLLGGQPARTVRLAPELMARKTTAPPPAS